MSIIIFPFLMINFTRTGVLTGCHPDTIKKRSECSLDHAKTLENSCLGVEEAFFDCLSKKCFAADMMIFFGFDFKENNILEGIHNMKKGERCGP